MEDFAKNNFSQEWHSADIRLILDVFWVSLGTLCMTFGAMGACLKFHGFLGLPTGTHELRECAPGKLNGSFPGP